MMTTDAAVKLIPIPPALVERRKTSRLLSSPNSSTNVCRTSTGVDPVRTRNFMSWIFNTFCKISST